MPSSSDQKQQELELAVSRALDSKSLTDTANAIVEQVAPNLALASIGARPSVFFPPAKIALTELKTAVCEMLGVKAEEADLITTALLLNASQGALIAAKEAIAKKACTEPPYCDPEKLPIRRSGAELFPFRPLSEAAKSFRFESGDGTRNNPYLCDSRQTEPVAFINQLRTVACLTGQPVVYGKDNKGLLEVFALIPKDPTIPAYGTESNPFCIDPKLFTPPYTRSWVEELARRTAIVLDRDTLTFEFVLPTSSFSENTCQFIGRGTKEDPRIANADENEAEFLARLNRMQIKAKSPADWVLIGSKLSFAHIFSGDGRTVSAPLRDQMHLGLDLPQLKSQIGLLADFRSEIVFYEQGARILALLPNASGESIAFPFQVRHQQDLELIKTASKTNSKPIYFKNQNIDGQIAPPAVCIPTETLSEDLKKRLQSELLERHFDAYNLINSDGQTLEKLYPFDGNGSIESPFQNTQKDLAPQDFKKKVLDYMLVHELLSTQIMIDGKSELLTLCNGTGSLEDPITNPLRDTQDWLLKAGLVLRGYNELTPSLVLRTSDNHYFTVSSDPFEHDGTQTDPHTSKIIPAESLRKQIRDFLIVNGQKDAYIKVGDKPELIEGILGSGKKADPLIIPTDAPEALLTQKYFEHLRRSCNLDVAFITLPDGSTTFVMEQKLSGTGQKDFPLICSNLEEAQNAIKLAEALGNPVFAKVNQIDFVYFPQNYSQRDDFIRQMCSDMPILAWGRGTIEDPILFRGISAEKLMFGDQANRTPIYDTTVYLKERGVDLIFMDSHLYTTVSDFYKHKKDSVGPVLAYSTKDPGPQIYLSADSQGSGTERAPFIFKGTTEDPNSWKLRSAIQAISNYLNRTFYFKVAFSSTGLSENNTCSPNS